VRILYVSSDLGIPVLGHRGGSIHIRSLVEAFGRAGHSVVLASPLLTKSPWERPARADVPIVHVRPSAVTAAAARSLDAFEVTVGASNTLPGEVLRILYDDDFATALRERCQGSRPDVIYERCAIYGTAGARVAREIGVPVLAVVGEGDREIAGLAAETIEIAQVPELLSPLMAVVPLQLLAYHLALVSGSNPDTMRADEPPHARALASFSP